MSTIKTDTAWPSGIDSSNNSECAQKNSKVTQKKKKLEITGVQNFTHTLKPEDILKGNNQE